MKKIKTALVSVFHKDGLGHILKLMDGHGIEIYSTGGTADFIESCGIGVKRVEHLTDYPSILGGRVKTLHPKIFGGILARRDHPADHAQLRQYEIPEIDLVVVDLYPFSETVASRAQEPDIIEKIDIGGISLIRAAAKNFAHVAIVPSKGEYGRLQHFLEKQDGATTIEDRRSLSLRAFQVSSAYDAAIFSYFNQGGEALRIEESSSRSLRYGENPHQRGTFYGPFDKVLDQLNGKELSYNNLLDIEASLRLIRDFKEEKPTYAILKHNNACGLAVRNTPKEAYLAALAGDPVSAFGGIIVTNRAIDGETAEEINKLFCEVVIAPHYSETALTTLKSKKNRILLVDKGIDLPSKIVRTALNGFLEQDADTRVETAEDLKPVTVLKPEPAQVEDLLFANKLVKHTKSNTIVLAKNKQLCASGTGQTSRVDALKQAIAKAKEFGFDLNGAVMASDAFFPFPDCVEIAGKEGIKAVIQPGGSVKDQESIDYCNQNGISMVFTGIRHFKH